MARLTLRTIAFVVGAGLLSIGVTDLASASHNLDARWKGGCALATYDYFVFWYWDASPQNSTTTATVNAAAAKWTEVGTELIFSQFTGTGALPPCHISTKLAPIGWPNQNKWAIELNVKSVATGNILSASIRFNDPPPFGVTWNKDQSAPTQTEIDLFSVAVHEIGHAVALNHSNCTPTFSTCASDVMYYGINAGVSKRTPTTHDRISIAALYPWH